jgi:hypothetical protein
MSRAKASGRNHDVSAIDFTRYSKILFIDSMVALEGKPLPTQPWALQTRNTRWLEFVDENDENDDDDIG